MTRVHDKPSFGLYVQIAFVAGQHAPTSTLLLLQLRALPKPSS